MTILQKLGSGGKLQGSKMLEALVHSIITPKMLSNVSWSGRAGKGKEKKIALSKYDNIIALITSLCQKSDDTYTSNECLKDLKYKILKYAYSKCNDDNVTSDSEIVS